MVATVLGTGHPGSVDCPTATGMTLPTAGGIAAAVVLSVVAALTARARTTREAPNRSGSSQ
jgi:hypothetical protein